MYCGLQMKGSGTMSVEACVFALPAPPVISIVLLSTAVNSSRGYVLREFLIHYGFWRGRNWMSQVVLYRQGTANDSLIQHLEVRHNNLLPHPMLILNRCPAVLIWQLENQSIIWMKFDVGEFSRKSFEPFECSLKTTMLHGDLPTFLCPWAFTPLFFTCAGL